MRAYRRFRLALLLFCASMLATPWLAANAATVPQAGAASTKEAAQALQALFESDAAWRQKEFGYTFAEGEWREGDRLPSTTPETWGHRIEHWQDALAKLDAIPADRLSREDQVSVAVLRTMVEADLNNAKWRTYETPFNSDTFFWGGMAPRQPYRSVREWESFIGRLADVPRYFDENIANMERGLDRGWSVPRASLDGRDGTIVPYTKDDSANPYLAAFDEIPATIPESQRARLRNEGRKAVLERVVPAYRKLLSFIRDQYLPRTRTTLAASALPGGREFYQSQIREYVTLDMGAREIHELGLAEVERISREMGQVMRRAGFKGSFEEFLAFLRTDPQFYAKTPKELLADASYVAKKVDGQLKYTFDLLPRYRFTILPVPDDIAPNYTSGRGGLDSCVFNTYDLASRPLYNLPALVLHECSPGHSFQAALALEAPNRPGFRQQAYFSGYGEGWGLYSEWLGVQMGIYETPYEDFGRLTFEMWRAARLVVDTGIHEYGWSRQQAIDYLASHTALAAHDIANEVDRYISWPGQALSYYIGYKTIRGLRDEAERELGDKFDQRSFHSAILGLGAVPLPVLEKEIRAFIAARKNGNEPAASPH